ncbi:MAG: hypothetical protein IKT39_02495 [Clostridia bacterium]|nr:hypothetical protein [Clostridia bacterium]
MANVDWIKIKNEYINTNISYRKLAEKYEVSKNQVANRAKDENWQELRKVQQDKIGTKLGQKTADKIVDAEVDRIGNLLTSADTAQKKIDQALEQLTKYVNAEGEIVDSQFINVKELRAIIASMKDLKEIIKTDNSGDMRKLDEVLGKIEGNI